MNKKFLSAILFGAMMTASTTVFVSCEDYGDDIAHLQEQIDQNATTAESELAAKVAALQAQLSTLEAAQKSMTEQLAAAKAEVATAAANAAAAAQAAQAAADKAQGGADEAKAAAAAAQAAADKANQTLSEAVARVAVLEAKATSLQASIDELSAASKEASAKLAEIQALVNTLNASTTKNAADIAKLGEQVSALNAELGKVSTGLSARIDAIDKELNTIKTTYATKSELDAKAEVLANMDAQLKLQIESNLNYIKEMQAAIASLGEKDKELAAAIEKNYADVLAEIEELATSQAEALAALEAAVKAGDAKLDEAIKAVQAVAEANAAAIKDIQAALATKADKTAVEALAKDLAQAIADIAEVTADLAAHKTEVAKELADINAKIADLDEVVQGLVSQALTNWNAIVANQEAIENLQIDVMDLISQLTKQVAGNWDAITKNQEAIFDINEDLTVLYDLVAQLTTQVTANWDQITKNMESIVNNTNDIADLDGIVSGLIKQVQGNWDAIVANQETIVDHEGRLNDIEDVMTWLIDQAETNWDAIVANQVAIHNLEVLLAKYPDLEKTVADLVKWTEDYDAKYEDFVKEQSKKIEDEIEKLTEKIKNIDVLNADVKVLKEQMAAVLGRIQSIAFVPEYMNANGNVIVPSFYYNKGANIVDGVFKATDINVKFRVQPAEAAEALAALWADEETRECFSLECANQLQTRAAATGYAVSDVQVAGNGVIVVTGKTPENENDNFKDGTWAYTLVVEDALATKKTSDYFNVETQAIDLDEVTATHAHENIEFTDFTEYYPAKDMTISYVTVGNLATGDKVSLEGLGRKSSLRIEAVNVGTHAAPVWVSLWANTYKYANGTSVYSQAELDGIKTTLNNFWANAGKYFVPVSATNNDVQVKGLETEKVVDKNGINSVIELLVVDQNFGRDNTAGKTTPAWGWQKSYVVSHKITENKTAKDTYNFNKDGNKLAWRFEEPAGTHHEVFADNGLEWLKYGISSAPALAPTAINSKISIREIKYNNGVKASPAQVKEVLNTAITADNATDLKRGNVAYGNVIFAMDGDAVKATVSFNNNIPYGHTYTFTKEYATDFGKITLTGEVKLTINGATQEDMLKHTINWKGESAYNLGITNPYMNATPVKYVPDWSFDKGYDNYTKYTLDKACTYEWYLLPAVVGGGTLNNSTNINSVSSALSTVVLEDASQIKGYKFNLGKVMFDRYITAEYTKDTKVYTVKGSAALAKLQFVTIVKDWNGNVVAHETGQFNYVDPIKAPVLAPIQFTADQCKNIVNEPLIICNGINVTDIYNQPWYVAGELDDDVETVWGAKDVVYSIENAAEVAKVAGDLHIDSAVKDAVKVVFSNYQWASDLVVKVKVSIEYSYGLVESTFDVTLPANPTLQ